jgi:predicted transcriptional regulator
MAADGLTIALEDYQRAQDELVEARNRLARAIAGAAMSGMTRDEIVDLTGYTADRVLRICQGNRHQRRLNHSGTIF